MASRSHLDNDDDFGGDFPGANPNILSGTKRSFGDFDDDEDDTFGSKKSELEAAKLEVQKLHSAFHQESFIPAGSTVEPRVVINYLQSLKSSEESLREQLEKTKRKEAAFIVTIAKQEQEIADLKLMVAQLEEREWIPDETHEVVASDKDAFDEEETWCSQYGQAIHLDKKPVPDYPVVDLWDWAMVKEARKSQGRCIRRLTGRLTRGWDSKFHPVHKTAPICEVHLDLVRVNSGKVYKLRTAKTSYVVSLSSFDSLDPTKGWGFPALSMEKEVSQRNEPKRKEDRVKEVESAKDLSFSGKGEYI